MHWETYERLRAEQDAFCQIALRGIVAQFGWTWAEEDP
jgi:hypothetical protein